MTCQEFKTLFASSIGKGGPAGLTRAERSAAHGHLSSCRSCSDYFTETVDKVKKNIPKEILPAIDALIDQEVKRIWDADLEDPEFKIPASQVAPRRKPPEGRCG